MAGGGPKRSRDTRARVGVAAVFAAVATILSGGLAWGQPLPAEPDPSDSQQIPMELSLSQTQGPPGTTFTATATRSEDCPSLHFSTENGQSVGVDGDVATVTVPNDPHVSTVRVSATCSDETVVAIFTVTPPQAALELVFSPSQGRPGSQATATLHGCTDDEFVLRWENQAVVIPPSGEFTVPADDPGTRTITATCGSAGDDTAEFTVLAAAQPTLELDIGRGPPGSTFRAIGNDFACGSGGVELLWGGSDLAKADSGSFDETLTVPRDAQARQYTVRAACVDDPDVADETQFTVTENVVTGTPAGAATVALDPTSGTAGDQVSVTGTSFLCDNGSRLVQLDFGGRTAPSVSVDAAGGFRTTFTVPLDAAAGTVILRASCADGSVARTASFTVIASPVIPTTTTSSDRKPPPNDGVIVLVVLLVLAAVAIVAVMVYRGLRKPRPPAPNPRVRVEQRIGDPPDVVLRETAGRSSHAIRLSIHPGSPTHTIERGER